MLLFWLWTFVASAQEDCPANKDKSRCLKEAANVTSCFKSESSFLGVKTLKGLVLSSQTLFSFNI